MDYRNNPVDTVVAGAGHFISDRRLHTYLAGNRHYRYFNPRYSGPPAIMSLR